MNSGSWLWTGRSVVLRFIESQRVGHDWVTELNWTELRNQRSNCQNVLDHRKKQENSRKNIYFIDYAKAFDCVYHKNLWKILKNMEIPDHLTCNLRNLYAGQETTVRIGHGKMNWFKIGKRVQFSSVHFSSSVVLDSLQHHGLKHTRTPCPSLTPGVYSISCPLSRWCHPTISSSVIPFSSHLQSFPASGSFKMSQLFASGGQSIGVSASTSVLPMNTQDWSPLGWTGWISF